MLTKLHLERLHLPAAVIETSLETGELVPGSTHDGNLFSPTGNNDQQQFLSRLYARLGKAQVRGISIANDHRPEAAHRWGVTNGPIPLSPDARPLWLLPRPQPLTQAFVLLEGPERITTGWWQPPPIRRDYFIARLESLALAWVFRDHRGHWYLHGWFG